ncbi:AAA family ATPase [Saprospira grandis]|uniref:SMC domain-containing protein n=1 Tax=Saprospira grandis (strain Lewin) TaxID=984262 RepID=H6L625_SAPGL|nr:AAA family ATPase [Saprospira grandis]AFC26585.1 SMC domain-containing protein [Saprospira grandis str. Lewin]
MQLKSLSIEGFRGFKDRQEIIFPENGEPLVILGVNGAGKTAVLEAIRAAIAPFVFDLGSQNKASVSDAMERMLKYQDIHLEAKRAAVFLKWSCDLGSRRFDLYAQTIFYKRDAQKVEFFLKKKNDYRFYVNRVLRYDTEVSLPVISYYASDRNIRDSSLDFLQKEEITTWYANTLSNGPVDFKRFFSWYRFTEDIENEQRLGQEDFSYKHPQLEAVRQAIIQMMGDEFKDLRIQRSPYVDMILKKQGAQLSVMQLSSGEKALLALAGDLAMRLALANEGEEHPLRGAGVVMIDEIDLHLHPSWQRKVVSRLRQTFPNIQFILTTHSPLVINHLKAESLYLLKDNQCFPVIDFNPYGADIETVLAWQGLSPEEIQGEVPLEGISKTLQLIQDNQLQKAKEEIVKLKKEMDKEHPKIKALESQIEIKEMLNGMDL